MKVSVSIPDDDVRFLDEYAREQGLESRSAAVHRAVRLLRTAELAEAYQAAWEEWGSSSAEAWDPTASDGVADDAAR
jgi:Arc/MetJ-type ribon-helix-helix transcriptional regulator